MTENRAQNNIEYHQMLLSYVLGNEAKRNADIINEQACDNNKLHNKLPVPVIVCVSLAFSCMHANLPEFPRYFYCLIF